MGTELGKGLEHQGQLRGVSLEKGGSRGTLFCTTPCQEGAAKGDSGSAPMEQEETASSCTTGRLIQILGKISSFKD